MKDNRHTLKNCLLVAKNNNIQVPHYYSREQKIRFVLWKVNPICCYCKQMTFFSIKHRESNEDLFATIEHIYWNGDLRRLLKGESRIKISCHKCNAERGNKYLEEYYSIFGYVWDIDIKRMLIPSNKTATIN